MKKLLLLSLSIALFLMLTGTTLASHFSDTENKKYHIAIEYLAERGIVEGYSDGTFRSLSFLNRAELLKIILESNEIEIDENADNCFFDIDGQWYAKYACTAKKLGIVQGYNDGTFRPANSINFAEALKIIQITYGADVEPTVPWYQTYLDGAEVQNLTPPNVNSFNQIITRGQMADIMTRFLTNIIGTQEEYIESLNILSYPIVTESSYTENYDGTIVDNVTGLTWQKDPGSKTEYFDAINSAYEDWRVPTIKELYSLIDFDGTDPSGHEGTDTSDLVPFIDDDYFDFEYGDPDAGDRIIDSQWVTSSIYVSTVMNNQKCFFGVNFADGRIKCYPSDTGKEYYAIYVRGNTEYGDNSFVDNGDSTITDEATGLMWQQIDSYEGMNFYDSQNLCAWATTGNYDDWRLPHVKELQSIVDYNRSPATTNSSAIDPMFIVSEIEDEEGFLNYPFYWSNTPHKNTQNSFNAAYVAFGEALGWMQIPPGSYQYQLLDVHGAGAQRSDPKQGDADDWPYGHGPQGDVVRIDNYARCVRSLYLN